MQGAGCFLERIGKTVKLILLIGYLAEYLARTELDICQNTGYKEYPDTQSISNLR